MSADVMNNPNKHVTKAFLLFVIYTLVFGLSSFIFEPYIATTSLNLINRGLLLLFILALIYFSDGLALLRLSKSANKHEFWILSPMLLLGGITFVSPEINWSHPNLIGMLTLAIVMAISEELLFRGYILSLLEKSGRFRAGLITALLFGATNIVGFVSPVIFGALDYRMVCVQIIFFSAIGLIMGAARLVSGSLWMVLVANFIFKFSAFLASGGVRLVWTYSEAGAIGISFISIILSCWGLFCCWLVTRKLRHDADD